MRTSFFVLNEAIKNIFINFSQTLITILIMFLSITTTFFFLTIGLNIHNFINELSERVQIVAYLHDDINIENIYRQLKRHEEIELKIVQEIARVEKNVIKWSFVFWITQVITISGIMAGLFKLFIK